MNKFLTILAVVSLLIVLTTSCKKQCTCITTGDLNATQTIETKGECSDLNSSYSVGDDEYGMSYETVCN